MNRTTNTILFSLILTVGASACSVNSASEFVEVDQSEIPFDLSAPETTAITTTVPIAAQTTVAGAVYEIVDLYFIKNNQLLNVQLEIGGPTNPQNVFAALIAGLPDPAHSKVTSLLPANLSAIIEVQGGVANINLQSGILDSLAPSQQRLAIAQISLTLTSQPGIGQVTFSVNGKPIGVPRGKGDIAAAGIPVAFDDYKMLISK
jgi:spore germination protein GerM